MGLQCHATPGRNFLTHYGRLFQTPGFEDEAARRGRKIVTNETSPRREGFIDHFLIRGDIASQWLRDEYMGIHRTKMEFVWKAHTLERSHMHMQGMGIRTANGHNPLPICQQIIPALKCFKDGTAPDELREECIKRAMQLCVKNSLQFT